MKKVFFIIPVFCLSLVFAANTKTFSGQQTVVAAEADKKSGAFLQGGIKESIDRGKKVFEAYCLACHQANGKGVPGMNPLLVKTKWVLGDKKKLIAIILKGLDEEVEIDGEVYNSVMPPQATLSDQEVADVLTYVRNSFGNKASAVNVAEVKKQREN